MAGGFLFSGVAGEYAAAAPLFVSFQEDLIISSSSSLTIPDPKRLERLKVLTHNARLASGRGQQRLPPPHNNSEDLGWKQTGAIDGNWYQRRTSDKLMFLAATLTQTNNLSIIPHNFLFSITDVLATITLTVCFVAPQTICPNLYSLALPAFMEKQTKQSDKQNTKQSHFEGGQPE